MAFSSAVFAARTPAMGNSVDRAWQLSQLMEGVSTACNPSMAACLAVLSALLVIQLFGLVIPPTYFPQRAPKGALRPFAVATLLHYVSWCASEYSDVGRISCHDSHDSVRTNVC